MNNRSDIRKLSQEEICEFLAVNKESSYRGKQVYDWLWKKNAGSFDEMTNLSKQVRELLAAHFYMHTIKVENQQVSNDKTIKIALRLFDDAMIEAALIPAGQRATACISSQTGCNLACRFCASGLMKNERNLGADEIFGQVDILQKIALDKYKLSLSNIVFMGMGEPLLNYANVLSAINKIISPEVLGFSPRRITLSTVGVTKMIKKLADDEVKFNLAVSLHSANEFKRNSIIPFSKSDSLDALARASKYFYEKTRSRITYEYLLLKDFNDGIADAKELAVFCKNVPCKINLIQYNPVSNFSFQPSEEIKVQNFFSFLESKNMVVNLRKSRGADIDAACGQLLGQKKNIE